MKKNTSITISLLGKQGSGKGTQARILEKKFHLFRFTSGEHLRALAEEKSFVGKKTDAVLKKGELVPSWLISNLWMSKLIGLSQKKGIIFDGTPRKLIEAKLLSEVLLWLERAPFLVLDLHISDQEAVNRIQARRECERCKSLYIIHLLRDKKRCKKCGGKLIIRADDKITAIKKRISWSKNVVGKTFRYYKKLGFYRKINGEQPIEKVSDDIEKEIFDFFNIRNSKHLH